MPKTPIVAIDSAKLRLKFLTTKTPPNPLPNFATNLISISLLTTFKRGATTVSTHVVVIPTPSD
jgi:hypothetical protein